MEEKKNARTHEGQDFDEKSGLPVEVKETDAILTLGPEMAKAPELESEPQRRHHKRIYLPDRTCTRKGSGIS